MLVIMKDDPLFLKIKKALKNFKEDIMLNANFKLIKWRDNRNKKFMEIKKCGNS